MMGIQNDEETRTEKRWGKMSCPRVHVESLLSDNPHPCFVGHELAHFRGTFSFLSSVCILPTWTSHPRQRDIHRLHPFFCSIRFRKNRYVNRVFPGASIPKRQYSRRFPEINGCYRTILTEVAVAKALPPRIFSPAFLLPCPVPIRNPVCNR